jgi:hypothetical protein
MPAQNGSTRERIRQIEAKALRKMSHPTRIRKLEGFIELPGGATRNLLPVSDPSPDQSPRRMLSSSRLSGSQ